MRPPRLGKHESRHAVFAICAQSNASSGYPERFSRRILKTKEGVVMKEIILVPASRTVALLAGLAVGLGIAMHEIFFVVAAAIAWCAATEWTIRVTRDYFGHPRPPGEYPVRGLI